MLRSSAMLAAVTLALAALSCSPPSGPAPKGAVHIVSFTGNCSGSPYVIPAGGTPTTSLELGSRVTDGSGAEVSCSVKRSGEGFNIDASIQQSTTSASMSGSVAPAEVPASGTGMLSFYAPGAESVSGSGCQLNIGDGQRIQPGAAWGSMTCPGARKEATGQVCDIQMDFVFENCSD